MAGDTYSFVIDNFQEKNLGLYSITAENQFGKATCSAEILFEGYDFSQSESGPHSKTTITEELVTKKLTDDTEITSKTITKTISTETKCTETMPCLTRDLSTQSSIPQMRDMSSQSQLMATRDAGIQIETEQRDKGSQIEVTRTKDGSSQWIQPSDFEIESFANFGNESAPFVIKTGESVFNDESTSYSYTQKSLAYNSSTVNGTTNVDFSTTVIKDVHPHYEPVELIINRDTQHSGSVLTNLSSSTYVKEIDDFHHRALRKFEPVNLIFHKPHHRSGSLPPLCSRINFKSSAARSDFDHTETDDESYYVYADRSDRENYMHLYGMQGESRMTYYKEIERRSSRPSFKPVELILDASSISDSGKRYRDTSVPLGTSKRIRMPLKQRNYINSSFIYENNNNDYDYDSTSSDFISDRFSDTRDVRYTKYASFKGSFNEDRDHRVIKVEQKLPAMEMTIDLKAPPTIDVPLKNITVYEGQTAKLECVLSGNKIKLN